MDWTTLPSASKRESAPGIASSSRPIGNPELPSPMGMVRPGAPRTQVAAVLRIYAKGAETVCPAIVNVSSNRSPRARIGDGLGRTDNCVETVV
jgi:hypothetical protein